MNGRPVSRAFLCLATAVFWLPTACDAAASTPVVVVAIGDSLITGHGLPTSARFPAVLEQRLNEAGYHAAVIDTGFHYTSRAGLDGLEQGRVDLSAPDTVAIVELGSNDCPDGLALGETRANLGQILAKLTEAKIPVLLVGTAAFAFCGADYVAAFEQMFVDLSEKYGTLFYLEFRAGALGHPELLQDDGDHPNEAGEVVVVNRMLPLVEELIARVQPQQGEASPRQAGLSPDWSLP